MTISSTAQAVLLLTAHFNTSDTGTVKPLTPKEYGRFAEWLHQRSLTPAHLLGGNLNDWLDEWRDQTVSIERVKALLERGSALAFSMEKWLRSGLWVMIRSDPDYPRRLKQRLGSDSPAALFGCGHRGLLNRGGLAVAGSRNVEDADLTYSHTLGALAARAGVCIVSGGARGIDEMAMLGALEAEGTAIGILADSLLRACSGAKYRNHLMTNNLVLVSPFNPEAGFNTGNAMQRNKYIYCLADAALAVHSGTKGGTWTGAQEVLKKGWVPLWVKPTNNPQAGNSALINAGALAAPAMTDSLDVTTFFTAKQNQQPAIDATTIAVTPQITSLSEMTFYELFVVKVKLLCGKKPCTVEDLVDALELNKTQLNAWLKQAVEKGELKKLTKPVRYAVSNHKQSTLVLN